jgi:phenylacetate-coenzyme A ligase PaaK-like adenylate-forming protein
MNREEYFDRLINIGNESDFETLALKVFHYQYQHNQVYSEFVNQLGVVPDKVQTIREIPFLPIEFFKDKIVLTGTDKYQRIFTSSGTTGGELSQHYIKDVSFYEKVFTKIFSEFYGSPQEYIILALLPSYLEREGSSLVYMMEKLIQFSSSDSGFFLHDFEKLYRKLSDFQDQRKKVMLFGVTYALLDFISSYEFSYPELIVMETGGMKGKRKEMIREEVHDLLCKGFGVKKIHSEYGMTELLSQAYSKGDGIFESTAWMRIFIRDAYDPLKLTSNNISGGINIVDLANIDSCSFIATQDIGKSFDNNSFEVLGRFDYSEMRGCNLLIS